MCLNVSEMPLSVLNMEFDIMRSENLEFRKIIALVLKMLVLKLLMHFEIKLI